MRHGRQKKNEPRGPLSRFWGLSQNCKFYHVLSVSVVPSVSVESAMESNDVLNDVLLRCVFERYDAVFHVCATRRNRLWRPRKPLACGPKHCRFSRTSHGWLPTFCGTRESKVPASLRDWQGLDAEQAIL